MLKHQLLFIVFTLLLVVGCQQTPTESVAEQVSTRAADAGLETDPTVAPEPTAEPTEAATATPLPAAVTFESSTADSAETAPTEAPPATVQPDPTPEPESFDFTSIEGALISLSMQSSVGVLLDGLPADVKEQMIEDWMNAPAADWEARANRQARMARLRLNFRNFHVEGKDILPMPPASLWNYELDPAGPYLATIDDHELLMHDYTFSSTLLSSADSVAVSEPALVDIGGTWTEPFIFPADPDHLIQRTGNSCINEAGFPPNSYDAVNAWHFYDYTCTADSGGELGCHRLALPQQSCLEAVEGRIGRVSAEMQFERLEWDDTLADSVRLGEVTSDIGPDMITLTEDMHNNRIIYRWFDERDCAYMEGATGGPGWRRLLLFDATVHNTGTQPMHMGKANEVDLVNNVFFFDPCHGHFHFSNYGDFFVRDQVSLTGGKQAFCVQSTNRHSNNETAPLTHEYTCTFQGIQTGWVDEYIAGLDAQWVDITEIALPEDGGDIELGFAANLDKFMCEGFLVKDENGEQLWEPSDFLTSDGHTINRPQCDFVDDWDSNNTSVISLFIPPSGSYVTQPCTEGEMGPLRNCGFTEVSLEADQYSCDAREPVTVQLSELPIEFENDFVIRACERSDNLGGLACERRDAYTNWMAGSSAEAINFTCPTIRDSATGAGGFSLFVAPLYDGIPSATTP